MEGIDEAALPRAFSTPTPHPAEAREGLADAA